MIELSELELERRRRQQHARFMAAIAPLRTLVEIDGELAREAIAAGWQVVDAALAELLELLPPPRFTDRRW